MDNFKTLVNILLVVLCLIMLWYLFFKDAPVREPLANEPYFDNSYTNIREERERTFDEPYVNRTERERPVQQPRTQVVEDIQPESGKGFFDRFMGNSREREQPDPNYRNYDNPGPNRYDGQGQGGSYVTENPFGRNQQPPQYTENPQQREQPNNNRYSDKPVYRTERYTRDGKIATYKGPMYNGNPHGIGILEYDNGDIYVGEYRNGQRTGFGNSIFKKRGMVQVRKYVAGKKVEQRTVPQVSYGTMSFVHGGQKGTYYGPLYKQKPHGFGYFKMHNGNTYIGSYQYGRRNGWGNLIYADGTVLYLEYKDGEQVDSANILN